MQCTCCVAEGAVDTYTRTLNAALNIARTAVQELRYLFDYPRTLRSFASCWCTGDHHPHWLIAHCSIALQKGHTWFMDESTTVTLASH